MLRDELGQIDTDEQFASLFVWRGRPAESSGLLAMVTVMQFAEGLLHHRLGDRARNLPCWETERELETSQDPFWQRHDCRSVQPR